TLTVVDPPSCIKPTDLQVTSLTADSVVLSWNEVNSATEWLVTYGPAGFDPSSGGTTVLVDDGVPSYTIGGLDIGTAYDFYVQSICTGHDTSDYSVPLSVTTKSLYMYTVNCGEDPVDATFCYHADDPLSVSY